MLDILDSVSDLNDPLVEDNMLADERITYLPGADGADGADGAAAGAAGAAGYGTDLTDVFEHDVIRRYMLLGEDAQLSDEEQKMLESLPGPHLWNIYGHMSDDGDDTDQMPVSVRHDRKDVEIIIIEEENPIQLPVYTYYEDIYEVGYIVGEMVKIRLEF